MHVSYMKMFHAYKKIMERLGLTYKIVKAVSYTHLDVYKRQL